MAPRGEFRFLDGIAPADAAFEATGSDLAEVLTAAARALFSIIVDIESVAPTATREITVWADSEEELLYDWLSELVFFKDVQRELYCNFEVSVTSGEMLRLQATIKGDSVDNLTGRMLTDVKAITYHKLAIEKTETGLKATVVVDL
jgi:SHS2 domain-containing protein